MVMVRNIVASATSDHPDRSGRDLRAECAQFALAGDGLITRTIECRSADVVYVKSIATAYEGLCCLFCERGGVVRLVAPSGREAELDLLVRDLEEEFAREKDQRTSRCEYG
jgi:hypothetical protein